MVRSPVRDMKTIALRGARELRTELAPSARLMIVASYALALACALPNPAQAQEREQEPEPEPEPEQGREWEQYVSIGLGHAAKSGMDQVGSNLDTICYPTDACFAMEPPPAVPGYRWRYGIDADSDSGIEIGYGYTLGAWRVELAGMHTVHDLDQAFRSIEYLDGSARLPGDGTVLADVETSIDSVRTYILSVSGYRDWPMGALTAYVGVGAGIADIEVRGVRFSAAYGTNSTQAYDPPLSFYDGTQDADLSDTVSAVLLHLGADYPIGERTRLGAKLTYSWVDEIADTSRYAVHPMHTRDPDFTNENTFGSASGWQLSLVVKFAVRR